MMWLRGTGRCCQLDSKVTCDLLSALDAVFSSCKDRVATLIPWSRASIYALFAWSNHFWLMTYHFSLARFGEQILSQSSYYIVVAPILQQYYSRCPTSHSHPPTVWPYCVYPGCFSQRLMPFTALGRMEE